MSTNMQITMPTNVHTSNYHVCMLGYVYNMKIPQPYDL
jgi:hypothetical protein